MTTAAIVHLGNIRLPMEKNRLVMLFAGVNLFFTGVDVALAHAINSFVPVYEWIPILYAPLGAASCVITAFRREQGPVWTLVHVALMLLGVTVGILGTAFHGMAVLNPGGHLTWSWVVFGSPILAPLAFSGISLIGLYAATREPGETGLLEIEGLGAFKAPLSRTSHFLWLVALGFAASAITSIIDHAQYGYSFYKLIAIGFGVFATTVTCWSSFTSQWTHGDGLVYFWTMIAAVAVGLLGFGFHLSADLAGTGQISLERILSFAPIFAPLLYCDLGLLGLLVVAEEQGSMEN